MTDHANRLHGQTSPYLLQHADNPVAWQPWDEAALAEARRLDRPILLSIGYAACHWCHVMAHESFEDPETAALMNRLFVSIKVDREERPDIDHLYMSALRALGEQGGWPLTMFLAPDGAPFWGGTYFPPEPRWGRPSFRQALETVADAYRRGDELVSRNTRSLQEFLRRAARSSPGTALGPADLDAARGGYLRLVDPVHGGLRGAPKFPNAPIFRFLWQDGLRTGDRLALGAVRHMLVQMSGGGIYDHLGGGYARYATDAAWLVPHFEKMLYDNAQLLELLALAHADRPETLLARRIEETVGWLDRDMTALRETGLAPFAASEDADSEGEEGRFYVWSEAEIDRLLGDRSPAFKAAYDVSAGGNWEGRTILHRITALGDHRAEAAIDADRSLLFARRARRVRPARDDKVLADWNALAASALCRAAAVLDRPEWFARAAEAVDFLLTRMRAPDGRIQHAWRLGRVAAAGLVDDQAATARAALALFEATGDAGRLLVAMELADAAQAWFSDPEGAFYTTAADAVDVPLARPRIIADSATPSGIGLMAEVLARLYLLTGGTGWRDRADRVIRAFSGAKEQLSGMPTLLAAADLLDNGACAVIVGPADHPLARSLHAIALRAPDPAVAVLRVTTGADLPTDHPAHGKLPGEAGAAGFVCRAGVCGLPTSRPAEFAALLRRTPAPQPSPALSGECRP